VNERVALTGLQQSLRKRLLADVEDLPVLPHLVAELLRLNPSHDRYFDDVERLVAKDPGTTTRLLALANSAAQRGKSEVRSIPEAMVRLGARGISSLKKPAERGLWAHALETAHVAAALGRALGPRELNPEELYLAGLMHDIGRFVMLVEVGEDVSPLQEGTWEDPRGALDAEVSACGIDHAELGAVACEHWKMPETVARAARFHHSPAQSSLAGSERRFLDVVVAADWIVSRSALLSPPGLGPDGDEASLKVVGKSLPLWCTVEHRALLSPLREASEAAQKASRSMGFKA
jgi:putative nucleotidyltransferase with HDIG domain